MSIMAPSHIVVDEKGVARIEGTGMKVLLLIEAWKAENSSPEQLQQAFSRLSLGQIHSAIAYYYDNQGAIDLQLADELAEFDRLRNESRQQDSPLRKKLREAGYGK